MNDETIKLSDLTAAKLESLRPGLYKKIFDAGRLSERKRFTQLRSSCGGDLPLAAECFVDGKESPEAERLAHHKLQTENRRLRSEFAICKDRWENDPKIRDEFSTPESYHGYIKHELEQEQREADRAFRRMGRRMRNDRSTG